MLQRGNKLQRSNNLKRGNELHVHWSTTLLSGNKLQSGIMLQKDKIQF